MGDGTRRRALLRGEPRRAARGHHRRDRAHSDVLRHRVEERQPAHRDRAASRRDHSRHPAWHRCAGWGRGWRPTARPSTAVEPLGHHRSRQTVEGTPLRFTQSGGGVYAHGDGDAIGAAHDAARHRRARGSSGSAWWDARASSSSGRASDGVLTVTLPELLPLSRRHGVGPRKGRAGPARPSVAGAAAALNRVRSRRAGSE